MLSAFPCGRPQDVRRMRSSVIHYVSTRLTWDVTEDGSYFSGGSSPFLVQNRNVTLAARKVEGSSPRPSLYNRRLVDTLRDGSL